jgi:hypothetical protein
MKVAENPQISPKCCFKVLLLRREMLEGCDGFEDCANHQSGWSIVNTL